MGNEIQSCEGTSVQLNSTITSYQSPIVYEWTPATHLSSTSVSNPIVTNITNSQTYTLTITDADNCTATDQVTVNLFAPPRILALSPP